MYLLFIYIYIVYIYTILLHCAYILLCLLHKLLIVLPVEHDTVQFIHLKSKKSHLHFCCAHGHRHQLLLSFAGFLRI